MTEHTHTPITGDYPPFPIDQVSDELITEARDPREQAHAALAAIGAHVLRGQAVTEALTGKEVSFETALGTAALLGMSIASVAPEWARALEMALMDAARVPADAPVALVAKFVRAFPIRMCKAMPAATPTAKQESETGA